MVPAGGLPSAGGVAAGAIQTGGNVGGRLARCGAAVVATGTVGGAGESRMVHARRGQPARGLVAAATGGRGLDVAGRLTNCGRSVVAAPARIGGNPRVVKLGANKRRRGVAAVAAQRGLEMGRRLGDIGTRQACTAGVAAGAFLGRALEHAGNMARLATGIGVHARQRITRLHVVKIAGATLGLQRTAAEEQEERKEDSQTLTHGRSPRVASTRFLIFFQPSTPWHCSQRLPNWPSCTSSPR